VDEWYRFGGMSFFGDSRRVELAGGEIVEMAPIGPAHAAAVAMLNRSLSAQVGGSAIVAVQSPLRLPELSEPQPDIAPLRLRADFYASAHPAAGDVLFVVEVAGSSLQCDPDRKAVLYAQAGVPEHWVADPGGKQVLVLSGPGPNGYRSTLALVAGDALRPQMLSVISVPVSDCMLLG